MPVPSSLADLSTTAASNSPAGSDAIGTSLDDYLRTTQALLKQALSKGTDIASAGTIAIPNNGNYCVVTGTTTISTISDSWTGRVVFLKFSDALTLTYSASLILPGGVSITTVAGDCATFVNESTGVWRCIDYQRSTVSAGESASGPSSSPFSFRNRIINGSMLVAQRGTSGTFASGVSSYSTDRWLGFASGGSPSWSIGGSLGSGGGKTLLVNGTAGVTGMVVIQRIESLNCSDLSGKTVTVSARLYTANALTCDVSLSYANSADNFGTTTGIGTVSKSLSSGTTYITATFASLPANSVNGIQLQFSFGALTSGSVGIAEVQLELGGTATPFEQRPIQVETSLAQRYYWRLTGTNKSLCSSSNYSTTASYGVVKHPTTMRIASALDISNVADLLIVGNGASVASTNVSVDSISTENVAELNVTASGLTSGQAAFIRTKTTGTPYIGFNAEL